MPKGRFSPDQTAILHALEIERVSDNSWPFKTWISKGNRKFPVRVGKEVNAEAIWSPDSSALLVTFSDSGAAGQYHVLIYRIGEKRITVTKPVLGGGKLLKFNCLTSSSPNVGAISWGKDSSSLLLAVEGPPVSGCEGLGTFRVFEIEAATGKVRIETGQVEAKREFAKLLGDELENADDDCVRWPKTCEPPKPKRPGTLSY